jgi:hypothetical protein
MAMNFATETMNTPFMGMLVCKRPQTLSSMQQSSQDSRKGSNEAQQDLLSKGTVHFRSGLWIRIRSNQKLFANQDPNPDPIRIQIPIQIRIRIK